MSIQNLILGSLVSRGADRLLNPARYDKNLIDKFIVGGGFTGEGSDEDEKDKGPTTFGGIAKQGIMSLLAQAVLGPVLGPLALTLGQNFLDKRREEGRSFNPFDDDVFGTSGPSGIVANKAITLDGNIVDVGSDDYYEDLDKRDEEFEETGDYDVYSNTVTTGPNYGPVTSGTVFDAEDDGGSDNGGGGGNMSASDFSDDTAGTPFRYGGLASLYR